MGILADPVDAPERRGKVTYFADDFKRWAFAEEERANKAEKELAAARVEVERLRQRVKELENEVQAYVERDAGADL